MRTLIALVIGFGATYAALSIDRSVLMPGVSGDSVAYLGAAESLVTKGTLEVPYSQWDQPDSVSSLAHFPPGFPAILSLVMRRGVRPQPAAVWVMSVSAGVVLAFAFLLLEGTFGTTAGLLGTLLLFVTPVLAKQLTAIWSEPAFLALTLPMLYVMLRRPHWAWVYGFLAAAALSVRYIGVAGTGAAVLWAVLHARGRAGRVRAALAAGAPSAAFLVWWQSTVGQTGGTIRRLGVYGGWGRNYHQFVSMLSEWLVPTSWPGGTRVALVIMALVGLLLALGVRRGVWKASERRDMVVLFGAYSALYVGVLVASRLLADPRIPFDGRLMLPLILFATLIAAGALDAIAGSLPRTVRLAVAVLVVAWSVSSWAEIRQGVRVVNQSGRFYTNTSWVRDPVIRWIRTSSGPFAVIYSNEPELVFFQTGRLAKRLPRRDEDIEAFGREYRRHEAAIVFAYPLHVTDVSPSEIVKVVDVGVAVQTNMGTVLVPRMRAGKGTEPAAASDPTLDSRSRRTPAATVETRASAPRADPRARDRLPR